MWGCNSHPASCGCPDPGLSEPGGHYDRAALPQGSAPPAWTECVKVRLGSLPVGRCSRLRLPCRCLPLILAEACGDFPGVPSSFTSSLFGRLLSFCLPFTTQPIFNLQHCGRGGRAQAGCFFPLLLCLISSPALLPGSPPVLPSPQPSCPVLSASASQRSVLLPPTNCSPLLGPPSPQGFSWVGAVLG